MQLIATVDNPPSLPDAPVHAMNPQASPPLTYIDLFAGCGGLSLGLKHAGWEGVFAVERNPMAFETLSHNLIEPADSHFAHWPDWLPKKACSIQILTDKHADKLKELRGKVTLIAGGPPCQGFSSAGRRQKNDHRNKLYQAYIDVVALVRPKIVLLENVTGIKMHFGPRPKKKKRGRPSIPYSERIKASLDSLGYKVFDKEVLASDFGVPQSRTRFIAVGIDKTLLSVLPQKDPFDVLKQLRDSFLRQKKLPATAPINCQNALSDLEYDDHESCPSPDSPGFKAGKYRKSCSDYQTLMRGAISAGEIADSHRFVNHRAHIVDRFKTILLECTRGKNLTDAYREKHGLKKVCIVPMAPDKPAGTVTTIPDDMIHYTQPRALTVRECARLQSFPDHFHFKSKYTTGGERRKKECPRYTQVGNAVPPLLGEALGHTLLSLIKSIRTAESNQSNAETRSENAA